jgi:HEAT repeats
MRTGTLLQCLPKQRQTITLALAALVVVVIAIGVVRVLQPHYRGKSIGAWFYGVGQPDQALAPEAFRAMGERAIPFLVHRLERPMSIPTHRLLSAASETLGEIYRQRHQMWQCRAAFFLGELGPVARSAETNLDQATASPNWSLRGTAEVALMKIRQAPMEPLIEQLKDTRDWEHWYQTAMKVGDFGTRAKPAIPILLESLRHTNNIIQAHALIALGMIGCEPEKCVPAIVPFLSSTSISDRQKAIGALLSFGTNALPARKVIQQATSDSDPWVRMEAKRAMAILDKVGDRGQGAP